MSLTDMLAWLPTLCNDIQHFGIILYGKSPYRSVNVANTLSPLVVNKMSELLNTVLLADAMDSACGLHWIGQWYVLFDRELSLRVAHHITAEEREIYRVERVMITICSMEGSKRCLVPTLK